METGEVKREGAEWTESEGKMAQISLSFLSLTEHVAHSEGSFSPVSPFSPV